MTLETDENVDPQVIAIQKLGRCMHEAFEISDSGQFVFDWLYRKYKDRATVPPNQNLDNTSVDGYRLAFFAGQEDVINSIIHIIFDYKRQQVAKNMGETNE